MAFKTDKKYVQKRRNLAPILKRRMWTFAQQVYLLIPYRYKESALNFVYKYLGFFFRGMAHYESWKKFIQSPKPSLENLGLQMVSIGDIQPSAQLTPGTIAVHAHIFYDDLIPEIRRYLNRIPYEFTLFISTVSPQAKEKCESAFGDLRMVKHLEVEVVPNRGRDIAPFISVFGKRLRNFDFIAHIHSKKSLYNKGASLNWREYLFHTLFGSEIQIRRIFKLFENPAIGIIYPQIFSAVPYYANTWLANRKLGEIWCTRLNIEMPPGYFHYPVGSMFWARGKALELLFNSGIDLEDFPEEQGQTDGTLAHCIERLFFLVAKRAGFQGIIVADKNSPQNWSPWNFYQYLLRNSEETENKLLSPKIKLIIFDVFDTLLIRPLLSPTHIKKLVADRLDENLKSSFLNFRTRAESIARSNKNSDPNLNEIYEVMRELTRLTPSEADDIKLEELRVEAALIRPRQEIIELFGRALQTGKKVVLASDMFLPKEAITSMLENNGCSGWSDFYLSNESGFRKDAGELYKYILNIEGLNPDQVLMIGDNERSDLQIPEGMGMDTIHVFRPTELARGWPTLGPTIEELDNSSDLASQLSAGLVVARNFQNMKLHTKKIGEFPTSSHPKEVGYSIVGPMLTHFANWLKIEAKANGTERLYFLAREGEILKSVYDKWVQDESEGPTSQYLVVSRRSVSVPAAKNFDDIIDIAKAPYATGDVTQFLLERFGISLSPQETHDLRRKNVWPAEGRVSVQNREISHLTGLLKELAPEILKNSSREREALLEYLKKAGLNLSQKTAVVDVGYAATIQAALTRLLNLPIDGFYLTTNPRSRTVKEKLGVNIRSCYAEFEDEKESMNPFSTNHIVLEKLLSSNYAQVMHYKLDQNGIAIPIFRSLSPSEEKSQTWREHLRAGIFEYVSEAIKIRKEVYRSFSPSPSIIKTTFGIYANPHLTRHLEELREMPLDDDYSGRGLL